MTGHTISTTLWLRVVVATAICCAMLAGSRADNVIPFYTGNFFMLGGGDWSPGSMTVETEALSDSYPLIFVLDFSAPIENR
jgi:hypothetical protein